MGCCFSKEAAKEDNSTQQVFSWDRDDRPDPKDFTISNIEGETCFRKPGSVKGQQFIIKNCKDSSIYIYDNSAMVTIDDCQNCVIFLGPIKGSVFIRNCKNLKCAIACQQFRSRDCQKIETFLYCQTQPIIESSTGMKFSCFQYYYPELEEQFQSADLSVYNNTWSTIHDFTPVEQSANWSLIPENISIESMIHDVIAEMNVKFDSQSSVVPLTRQKRTNVYDETCLMVFFQKNKDKCKEFLNMLSISTKYVIVQTKEVNLSPEDAERIFKQERYNDLVLQGNVVGLELSGPSIVFRCEEVLKNQLEIPLSEIFISYDAAAGKTDVTAFYNYIDMMMVT